MADDFKAGDKVAWDSSQGTVEGTVERRLTGETRVKGFTAKATPENPEYLVRSDKTGAKAAHKPSELRKRSGGGRKSAAKKSTAKKSTAKKSASKRPVAKKAAAKKAAARKSGAKKAVARKSAAKRTTAKKTATKTSAARRRAR